MMTNYIGFMVMIIMILSTLVIFLIWGCVSLYRISRSEKKVIRSLNCRAECDESHNYELYLDCQTLLLLLYDVVLSEGIDMEYKATVIRSSLSLLGLERDNPYKVGTLQSIIETPDINKINDLVSDIINQVFSYSRDSSVFVDPKTLTALERFNFIMEDYRNVTKRNQERLDNATTDIAADPLYDQTIHDVHVLLSQRAQAIIA